MKSHSYSEIIENNESVQQVIIETEIDPDRKNSSIFAEEDKNQSIVKLIQDATQGKIIDGNTSSLLNHYEAEHEYPKKD